MSEQMKKTGTTIEALSNTIRQGHVIEHVLDLKFGECRLRLDTNSTKLTDILKAYFKPFLNTDSTDTQSPVIYVSALEMPPPELGLDFIDWKREPGKTGRKDSYADLEDGRVCRKVRSGMQFLMSSKECLAVGECLKYESQLINFLITQFIIWLMHREHALCHASALSRQGEGFAIAGFSGGGKSTLALQLMRKGFDFVSNDRTLIKKDQHGVTMTGVPKHPRVNPGTVLYNPALKSVIPEHRVEQVKKLSAQELWDLEEKYDADVEAIFGAGKFKLSAKLNAFVILNWKRNDPMPAECKRIDIRKRPDLLAAVMKSAGPFYLLPGNRVPSTIVDTDAQDYLPALSAIHVYEMTGCVDFDWAVDFCLNEFGTPFGTR